MVRYFQLELKFNSVKDLASAKPQEVQIALSCIGPILNQQLANDLLEDILCLLNHSHAEVRKKSIAVLYPIVSQIPDALQRIFPRLKQKLEDPDAGANRVSFYLIALMTCLKGSFQLPLVFCMNSLCAATMFPRL